MINLKSALAADVAEGLRIAQEKAVLPEFSRLLLSKSADGPSVEQAEANRGDYTTAVALGLGRQLKMSPMDIATVIAEQMPKKEYVGKIDSVPPGFLNFYLNPGWLTARLDDVLERDVNEDINIGRGQRILLEFISANPTGPLTLGNIRTAFSVDALANVLNSAGFNVTREYYINDAGQQIKKLGESVIRRTLIARGESVEYPEELYQGGYITDVASVIAERLAENDGQEFTVHDIADAALIERVGDEAAQLLLADIKKTLVEDLKITFDVWTSEKALRASGALEEALQALREKKATYADDNGAEWLKTKQHGDSEDRILVKSNGEYAYIMPDIAYHRDKFERKFDQIFTFIGADHQGHWPKLMAAMQALGYNVGKLHFVVAQWLRFVSNGRPIALSKRKGVIVQPRDLIAQVGYDATRYFMTMHALSTHMDFNLTLAQERNEKNPVYYVQYAHVRLQSILRRAKQEGIITNVDERIELTSHSALTHTKELELMRTLYRYPEIISEIASSFAVHPLTYFAYELAKATHSFYKHVPVLKSDDAELLRSRLQLILATRKVLRQVLDLLGIGKPDVM